MRTNDAISLLIETRYEETAVSSETPRHDDLGLTLLWRACYGRPA